MSPATDYTCKLKNIDYYGNTVGLPAEVQFRTSSVGKSGNDQVKETVEDQGFLIYPNPTSDKLIINFALEQASKVHIELFDLTGRLLFHKSEYREMGNQEFQFNNLRSIAKSSGVVLLKVVTDKATIVEKVIVE